MFVPKILLEQLLEELAHARVDRRTMLDTIVKMKVSGGSIPLASQGVHLPPRAVDRVQLAIDSHKYAKNPAIAAAMRAYADREIAKDDSPEGHARVEKIIKTWHLITKAQLTDDEDDTIALVDDDGQSDNGQTRLEVID